MVAGAAVGFLFGWIASVVIKAIQWTRHGHRPSEDDFRAAVVSRHLTGNHRLAMEVLDADAPLEPDD
jgi:hypothetical protein